MTTFRSSTHSKPTKEQREIVELRRGLETILEKLYQVGYRKVTIRGVVIKLDEMWNERERFGA